MGEIRVANVEPPGFVQANAGARKARDLAVIDDGILLLAGVFHVDAMHGRAFPFSDQRETHQSRSL